MKSLAFRKQDWELTQTAFDLLLGKLDTDREAAGAKYELLRRKLVRFLGYWGCTAPEAPADETLSRVARKMEEGAEIDNLHAYALRIARLVSLEVMKAEMKEKEAFQQVPTRESDNDTNDAQRRQCYERCLQALSGEERGLITKYYAGAKAPNRDKLSSELGKPVNSLRVAAFRIRRKLSACHENCLNGGGRRM